MAANDDGTCPDCYGSLEQVADTTLYRCTSCDAEFDEDELNEDES